MEVSTAWPATLLSTDAQQAPKWMMLALDVDNGSKSIKHCRYDWHEAGFQKLVATSVGRRSANRWVEVSREMATGT